MRKHTEEIKRIERGRVMFYSEFPTIFKDMPNEDKEGGLGGLANSASTTSASIGKASVFSLDPNKLDTRDTYNFGPSKAKVITDAIADPFKAD